MEGWVSKCGRGRNMGHNDPHGKRGAVVCMWTDSSKGVYCRCVQGRGKGGQLPGMPAAAERRKRLHSICVTRRQRNARPCSHVDSTLSRPGEGHRLGVIVFWDRAAYTCLNTQAVRAHAQAHVRALQNKQYMHMERHVYLHKHTISTCTCTWTDTWTNTSSICTCTRERRADSHMRPAP